MPKLWHTLQDVQPAGVGVLMFDGFLDGFDGILHCFYRDAQNSDSASQVPPQVRREMGVGNTAGFKSGSKVGRFPEIDVL